MSEINLNMSLVHKVAGETDSFLLEYPQSIRGIAEQRRLLAREITSGNHPEESMKSIKALHELTDKQLAFYFGIQI